MGIFLGNVCQIGIVCCSEQNAFNVFVPVSLSDSVILLWKLQSVSQAAANLFDSDESENKETWTVQKSLR